MKFLKTHKKFLILLIILIILVSMFGCTTKLEDQKSLADQFGVRIEDYPPEKDFPIGYFVEILNPEMSIMDIHSIILGYEKVYHCDDYKEVYFYFSPDDDIALRFEIFYDEKGMFVELRGEDDDSRTIIIDHCIPGLLQQPDL